MMRNDKKLKLTNYFIRLLYAMFLTCLILIPLIPLHLSFLVNWVSFIVLLLVLFAVSKPIFYIFFKGQSVFLQNFPNDLIIYSRMIIPLSILGIGSFALFLVSNYYLYLAFSTSFLTINF